jgi:hypothetical protein
MRKLLLITFALISNYSFSQLRSVVIDKETKEAIPYVNIWIEDENIGTTSNQQGEFEINIDSSATIVFSAIGFETRRIQSDSITKEVELKTSTTNLTEVVVTASKKNLKLTIGSFQRSKINYYFGVGTKPWITARYFPYDETYSKTPFLVSLKMLTNSDIREAKFNVRLYDVNDRGEPGNYIYDKNIIGIARKGKKVTEIDLSDLSIKFPKNGFFIAIEWFIIDENRYEYEYTMQGSKKKMKGVSYEPSVGTVPAETDENSWIYMQGQWQKVWKNRSPLVDRYKDKYSLLAIELTLTN